VRDYDPDEDLPVWERMALSLSTRDRMVDVVAGQLEIVLEKSATSWRSVESMATEIGADAFTVREALGLLGDKVRNPVGAVGREHDWYRLTSKGYTWQENWRTVRAMLSRTAIR
jgi:hypothetical protein